MGTGVPGPGVQGGRLGDSSPSPAFIWVCFLAGQRGKGHDEVEEITYRRALREALDILHQAMPSKGSPSKDTRSKAATWKETGECAAGHWLPSPKSDVQKREGKTGEASAAPQVVGTQNKRSRCSRGKVKGSSSAKSPGSKSRVLLRNGELRGQPQCASKAKTPVTPKKEITRTSLPRPGAIRRSPRFSKGQDEASRERSSLSSPKCLAGTSTPAGSSYNCAKSTPAKKPRGKPGLRRNLLGSPVRCPSAEAEEGLCAKEEFPPRKYSKDLDGERHPQDSKGTAQKQIPATASLCQERQCASRHKGSAGSPDPVGPVLDGIQEKNPNLHADEAKNFQLCDLGAKGKPLPCFLFSKWLEKDHS